MDTFGYPLNLTQVRSFAGSPHARCPASIKVAPYQHCLVQDRDVCQAVLDKHDLSTLLLCPVTMLLGSDSTKALATGKRCRLTGPATAAGCSIQE